MRGYGCHSIVCGRNARGQKSSIELTADNARPIPDGRSVCMVVFVGDSRVFTELSDIQDDYADIKSQWDGPLGCVWESDSDKISGIIKTRVNTGDGLGDM